MPQAWQSDLGSHDSDGIHLSYVDPWLFPDVYMLLLVYRLPFRYLRTDTSRRGYGRIWDGLVAFTIRTAIDLQRSPDGVSHLTDMVPEDDYDESDLRILEEPEDKSDNGPDSDDDLDSDGDPDSDDESDSDDEEYDAELDGHGMDNFDPIAMVEGVNLSSHTDTGKPNVPVALSSLQYSSALELFDALKSDSTSMAVVQEAYQKVLLSLFISHPNSTGGLSITEAFLMGISIRPDETFRHGKEMSYYIAVLTYAALFSMLLQLWRKKM